MKKIIILLAIIVFSCKNNDKEAELLEKENELLKKENEQLKNQNNQEVTDDAIAGSSEIQPAQPNSDDEIFYAEGKGKYPEGSERKLSSYELEILDKNQIKILRNEIYARHGYIFKNKELKEYFESQDWYEAHYEDVSHLLTKIEQENIAFIKENFE